MNLHVGNVLSVVTIGTPFVPITRPKLKSAYACISFGLYMPLFRPTTRIFLLRVQRREGEPIWGATTSDWAQRHQLWIIVVLHGVTWCAGAAAEHFADSSRREYDQHNATNP